MRGSLDLPLFFRHLHLRLESSRLVDQRLTLFLLDTVFLSILLQGLGQPSLLSCPHHQKVEFLRLDLHKHAELIVAHVDDSLSEFLEADAGQKFMDLLVAIYMRARVLFCSLISLSKTLEDSRDICLSPATEMSSFRFKLIF